MHEVALSGNPGSGIWENQESWASESVIQLKESEIQLTIGIWNPSSNDKESESRDQFNETFTSEIIYKCSRCFRA